MGATVFVVDDHAGFRRSARLMLEIEGYVVVGEAADGAAALTGVRQLEPDIALVDVHLPDVDGFELAARIAALVRPPVIILTSSRDVGDFTAAVTECGARGFVPKAELSREAIERLL